MEDRRRFLQGLGALLAVPIIGCGSSSSEETDAGIDALVVDKSVDTRLHLNPSEARNLEVDKTGHVKDIDPKDFDYEVIKAVPPVLVDFYATWCPPCNFMHPIVENLAKVCVGMKFVSYDIQKDLNKTYLNEYGVTLLPTYHFFHKGKWHPKYGVFGANPPMLEQMIGLFFKKLGIKNGVVYPDSGIELDASVEKDASNDLLLDASSDLLSDASSDLSKLDAGSMNYNPRPKNYDPKLKQPIPVGDYCDIKTRTLHKIR